MLGVAIDRGVKQTPMPAEGLLVKLPVQMLGQIACTLRIKGQKSRPPAAKGSPA